jgi:hypothetical protein
MVRIPSKYTHGVEFKKIMGWVADSDYVLTVLLYLQEFSRNCRHQNQTTAVSISNQDQSIVNPNHSFSSGSEKWGGRGKWKEYIKESRVNHEPWEKRIIPKSQSQLDQASASPSPSLTLPSLDSVPIVAKRREVVGLGPFRIVWLINAPLYLLFSFPGLRLCSIPLCWTLHSIFRPKGK